MASVKSDLIGLSDFAWQRLRRRLEGMSDEEYLWEPAPDCWTVRPTGDGSYRGDWGVVLDEEPPFTTIAWRACHIIDCLTTERWPRFLGVEAEPSPLDAGLPGTASAAIEGLERAHAIWRGYLTSTDEDLLLTKLGPVAGQYADDTRLALLLHVLDELVHHAAEVAVLRDLYRATRPQDQLVAACLRGDEPAVERMRAADPGVVERVVAEHPGLMRRAAAAGRWTALPLLVRLGFPLDGAGGHTPLHLAAGAGALDAVRLLVDAGADVNARDSTYDASPLGWAQFFQKADVAEYLAGVTPAA